MKNFWNRISLGALVVMICLSGISIDGCSKQAQQEPQPIIEKVGLEIGDNAPNFTMGDQNGKSLSLKDFKGKVVMLDFWATWCGPCVASIPHVKDINTKYAGKDVVILSVSLDKDLDQWKSFIADEQMNWMHVADGNYWNNAAAVKYHIESIPNIWIVDKTGKIAAKELHGSDVETAIEAALTAK